MERLAKYRQIVRTFLREYSKTKPINGDLEIQVLFDTEHDHYQIVDLGWDGYNRIYSCQIHLDIRNEKVWIQRNQTDELIAEELVSEGCGAGGYCFGASASLCKAVYELWCCLGCCDRTYNVL